jgi:hypothetical protein
LEQRDLGTISSFRAWQAAFQHIEVTCLRLQEQLPQQWDLNPDGKRFLMMKEVGPTGKPAAEGPRKINIVLNWFEELKRRVPK